MNIDRDSHIPVYLQVKDLLTDYIVNNHLKAGDPLPSLLEICDMAEVSLRTAQRAALAMLEEGSGRRLGRRFVVGNAVTSRQVMVRRAYVLCYELGDGEFDDISMKIINAIRQEVGTLPAAEVMFAGNRIEESLNFCINNNEIQIAGVIMLHWQNRARLVELASNYPQLKFVQVNHVLAESENLPENILGVFNDDFAGTYQATQYLLARGYRKPVFLELGIKDETYHERRNGFMAAMQENKLKGQVYLQEDIPGGTLKTRVEIHHMFFHEVFLLHPDMDAVVTCYDLMAQAAALYLKETGHEEIPVIGYDAYLDFGENVFDSVAVDYEKIGQIAVRSLNSTTRIPRFQKVLPQLKLKPQHVESAINDNPSQYFKIVSF